MANNLDDFNGEIMKVIYDTRREELEAFIKQVQVDPCLLIRQTRSAVELIENRQELDSKTPRSEFDDPYSYDPAKDKAYQQGLEDLRILQDIILEGEKPSYGAYALVHFYINEPITLKNKTGLGSKYGLSGDRLYNEYKKWDKEKYRLNDSLNAQFRSARESHYRTAMTLLETYSDPKPLKTAQRDFDQFS